MNTRQARLSRVMGVVAALGTVVILWAWWDSTEHSLSWLIGTFTIWLIDSKVSVRMGDFIGRHTTWPEKQSYFDFIKIDSRYVEFPMWFLLGVFISAMLLLWLVLMKRLARPRITEGSSHSGGG